MSRFFGVLVLMACATAPDTKSATKVVNASDFYPLTIGTSWQYEVDLLTEKSALSVSMVREVDGFFEDSRGARLQSDRYGVRDEKRYLLRNPIEPGTKWSNVVSVSSVEHYEIIGTQQPCEAPAGKWEGCVIVESRNRLEEGKTLVNEMTFAPGVGIVHLATTLDNKGQRVPQASLRLVSFSWSQSRPPTTTPEAMKR